MKFEEPNPLSPIYPNESEESHETIELTTEEVGKIMDKVEDIDNAGIAYSRVLSLDEGIPGTSEYNEKDLKNLDRLKSIFRNGILGRNLADSQIKENVDPQKWSANLRNKENLFVFFNITDRSKNTPHPFNKVGTIIGDSYYMNPNVGAYNVAILFDLSKYKEINHYEKRHHSIPRNTFVNDDLNDGEVSDMGSYVDTEYGFVLSSRVPPRLFKGIVVKLCKYNGFQEENGLKYPNFSKEDNDKEHLQQFAQKIGEIMIETMTSRENLIPIYDVRGNLLWPNYLPREQIETSEKQG